MPFAPKVLLPGRQAPGDGWNDGKSVSRRYLRRILVRQIPHILVVQVDIHKRTHFALAREQMLAQVRMRLREFVERTCHRGCAHGHRVLATGKLPQRRRNKNRHLVQSLSSICLDSFAANNGSARFRLCPIYSGTTISSCSNCLSSSVVPASRNEFVTAARPCSTAVIT